MFLEYQLYWMKIVNYFFKETFGSVHTIFIHLHSYMDKNNVMNTENDSQVKIS